MIKGNNESCQYRHQDEIFLWCRYLRYSFGNFQENKFAAEHDISVDRHKYLLFICGKNN